MQPKRTAVCSNESKGRRRVSNEKREGLFFRGSAGQQDGCGHFFCVRAQVKVAAVLQGEADLVHLLRAETTGGIFQRPAARKGVILPIGALGVELVVGGLSGQAVDPDGGNGLGVEVVEGDGVQPGRRGALPACCGKFCRRNDGAAGLIQVHLAVGHLRQVDKAVLQTEQLLVAGGAVQLVAVPPGIHADGHVVVAVQRRDVHGEHGPARLKIQHDVLPHAAVHILHEAVNITGGRGELHHGGVAEVVAAPDALHGPAVVGPDGIHPLDAGHDHAVALHQPVAVVDVLVALDGGIVVGFGEVRAAGAEPVADDGADGSGAVVVDDGGVFHRDRHIGGQLVDDGQTGHDGTGVDIQCQQAHGVQIVGEEDQVPAEGGRAAAAPGQTAAGGGVALMAVLGTHAVVAGVPDDLHAVVSPQQVAGQVRQDDRTLLAGGDAVFGAFPGDGRIDVDFVVEVGRASRQDGLDGGMGDIAHRALLAPTGVDAETARHEPEVALVVKDDGKELLVQRSAQHLFGCGLDVDVQHLFEHRQRGAVLVGGTEHQDVVVAGGADDEVPPVHERIGALDDIPAAVVLGGREEAPRGHLFRIQVPDGEAAQERADGVVEIVKEDGRRGIGVDLFHRHIDFRADADGQHGICGVGVVAVVVDVGLAEAHKGVGIHDLGGQRLGRKGGLRLAAQQPGQQAVGLLRMGGRCKAAGQQGECRCAEKAASCHFHRVDPPIFH